MTPIQRNPIQSRFQKKKRKRREIIRDYAIDDEENHSKGMGAFSKWG